MSAALVAAILEGIEMGRVVPYLGPGVLEAAGTAAVPASPEALAGRLTSKVAVPHKIRNNLTAAAQFIENFKHRKTLTGILSEAFQGGADPAPLHRFLAELPAALPLIVDAWYDDAMAAALRERDDWGQVQGVSQAEHPGEWVRYFRPDGSSAQAADAARWATVLYEPLGSIAPARNFLVSDSDYVEVLTEIDIQSPIPEVVQRVRTGRRFLFLGCRFRSQLGRTFARQIMKRSADRHWAVLPGELSRNEVRFLAEQGIERIDMPLAEFAERLTGGEAKRRLAMAG